MLEELDSGKRSRKHRLILVADMIEKFGDRLVLFHIKCTVNVNVAFLYTLQVPATCNCSALCSHVYN